MSISAVFIRRPVMTTLVMSAILIAGAAMFTLLPVSDLPNVDYPTIVITAVLPGANPETMASAVATPLEKQFSTIAGIDSMTATCTLGACAITLQFNLSRDIDSAALDVQAAISRASRQLPQDMPSPPSYQKVNPADQPILYLALTSPTLPLSRLDEYGQTLMAQRISMVSGVAQVQVYGSQKFAVRIQLDPESLASRGLGIDEVSQAVQNGNVNLPTGVLYGLHRAFTINTSGQLLNAEAYRPLVVAFRNGYPVQLSDLGRVIDSVENDKTAAWYCDGNTQQRAVVLAVQRQPGTNTVEVSDAVKGLLPTFRQQLPPSVSLHVLYDRSASIAESVHDVEFTLLLTLGMVVLVIFLFLRSVRATTIPSLTLPLSIAGTFGVMYILNYSVDNLSLMALTLSVGFVVDDAIVMLENIYRHLEMGKGRMQAALDGSREVGFTIVSMTLSLTAVFIPVMLMPGMIGRLFREFAVTIGMAVLVSGFVALTLTPMLASRWLRPESQTRGRLYAWSERAFSAAVRGYGRLLAAVLRHPRTTVLVSLAMLVWMVHMFMTIPKTFLPNEDRGMLFAQTEAAQGISYRSMMEHQQALAQVVQQEAEVESFMSSAGPRGSFGATNTGFMFLRLKPRDQRTHSADELASVLRGKLSQVPGINAYVQNQPLINLDPRPSKAQYQYTLLGPDTDELYAAAMRMEQEIRKLPGFIDISSDLQMKNPQANLDLRRIKASTYGVTAEQVEDSLYTAYGSRQISTIYAPNDQYHVIMELLPEHQMDPAALSLLYIRSSRGQLVPLKVAADVTTGVGPLSVNHSGQLPSVTIFFNLKDVTLGEATNAVNRLAQRVVPASVTAGFQGAAQQFQSSVVTFGLLFAGALLVIYIVLGILYESFIHPLTILSALPFACFGAVATLILFGVPLSLYSAVGVVMLIGLVKKNGIMMVDFAISAQAQGKSPREAIYEACQIRFRPIMMTTMAALVGSLPIAIGYGAGAESRQPLGLAVVGGLLFSQTLTLFVTPVIYLYMERFRQRFGASKVEREVTVAKS